MATTEIFSELQNHYWLPPEMWDIIINNVYFYEWRQNHQDSLRRIEIAGLIMDFCYENKLPLRFQTIMDECINIFNPFRHGYRCGRGYRCGNGHGCAFRHSSGYRTHDINNHPCHIRNESDQTKIWLDFYFPHVHFPDLNDRFILQKSLII